jgi:Fe-S-cluster containining protein
MQIPEELMRFTHPKHVCFACDRCAMCCGDAKGKVKTVLLLRTEAEHIAGKTTMSLQEFVERVEG